MGGSDSIQLYLRDIGEIPLLSRDEEEELAKRIQKGDENARKKMIRANLRLVVNIAKKYAHLGLPFLDLVEEGNIGLMKAVSKYDLSKGCKLSTYASWWIKQAIMRALANQGKTIRIPVYMVEKIAAVRKATEELTQLLSRKPTSEELSAKLDIPLKKVKEIEVLAKKNPSSLYSTLSDDGISELIDVLEDIDASIPSDAVHASFLQEDIEDLLALLTEREATIISMRYGLKGEKPKTLEEIGQKFKITRERVRQIEEATIKKLRGIVNEQKKEFIEY